MHSDQWLVFLPAAFLVAASPGAGNFVALNHGLQSGMKNAMIGLFGRICAFALLIAAVIVGLGAILASSIFAFTALKWAGVIYLVWLSYRLWQAKDLSLHNESKAPKKVSGLAVREFTVAVTNPKAILLFTAFIPQFVQLHRPIEHQLVLLGGAYIGLEFLTASGYAFVGSRLKTLKINQRGAKRLNRASASCMALAACWLATMKQHAP